ncbi:hypothetical protein [Streptomyces sp. NPDC050164]|uniref:hypothetical protein n=1 Tax=Streptomyces sp. NPDC050164 TaxID=3365605 RepID=UPI0037BB086B
MTRSRASSASRQSLASESVRCTVSPSVYGAEALLVSGMSSEDIGRAAARAGLVLFELAPRRRTVEDAYPKLTADSVEYRGSVQRPVEGSRA